MSEYGLVLIRRKIQQQHSRPLCKQSARFQGDRLIQDNFRSKLTLAETATHCNVSPEYLSRIFRKEMGITFQEYLKFCRLKTAHSILTRGTGMSVAEVAFACGFNDSNYFSTLYKQTYRTSPSQAGSQKENITE